MTSPGKYRPKVVYFTLTEKEYKALQDKARIDGCSMAAVVRVLVNRGCPPVGTPLEVKPTNESS